MYFYLILNTSMLWLWWWDILPAEVIASSQSRIGVQWIISENLLTSSEGSTGLRASFHTAEEQPGSVVASERSQIWACDPEVKSSVSH